MTFFCATSNPVIESNIFARLGLPGTQHPEADVVLLFFPQLEQVPKGAVLLTKVNGAPADRFGLASVQRVRFRAVGLLRRKLAMCAAW